MKPYFLVPPSGNCIVLSCTRINADGEDLQVGHGLVEGDAVVLGEGEQEVELMYRVDGAINSRGLCVRI